MSIMRLTKSWCFFCRITSYNVCYTKLLRWNSVLAASGIAVRVVSCGASEHEGFRAIWMAHLRAALAGLS